MTTEKAREIFRVECDKRSIGAYDTFIVDEIDYFISFAIRQFYERRLSGFTKDGASFEEWQKRIEDLRPVYRREELVRLWSGESRGCSSARYRLPDSSKFWHLLSEECVFEKNDPEEGNRFIHTDVYESTTENITARINNSLGDHIYYGGKVRPLRLFVFEDKNDYNSPDKRDMIAELYYIDRESKLDPKSIKYEIEYVSAPLPFGVEDPGYSEAFAHKPIHQIPEYAWDDVISIAVSHALENIGSPRVGTYAQEQQLIQ